LTNFIKIKGINSELSKPSFKFAFRTRKNLFPKIKTDKMKVIKKKLKDICLTKKEKIISDDCLII